MIAVISEVWNDRNGDLHKGADVIVRILLLVCEAVILHAFFHKPILSCFILSSAIFFLLFDYAITYVLIKNGKLEPPLGVKYHWFSYMAKKGVIDNISWWRNMNPWGRFAIRLAYFVGSLVLYFQR
jgi:hypothetical protein